MKRLAIRLFLLCALAGSAAVGLAKSLPPIDAFGAVAPLPDAKAHVAALARELGRAATSIQVESRLGVPTFLWAGLQTTARTASAQAAPATASAEENAARMYLGAYAPLYRLSIADVGTAELHFVHKTAFGPVIVRFQESLEGIEIFREEINVVMDRSLNLIAISGYISSPMTLSAMSPNLSFALDAPNAAANAFQDLTAGAITAAQIVPIESHDGYDYYRATSPDASLVTPLRLKRVYFHLPQGLIPGYYIEVAARDHESGGVDYYAYVISALDGSILFRRNFTADAESSRTRKAAPSSTGTAYTYRVWADPATSIPYDGPQGNAAAPKVTPVPDGYQAPFVASQLVTLASGPISTGDPWLSPGATETAGNNVDAYADLFAPDGYGPVAAPADPATGDFRAQLTGPNAFQHSYDLAQQPGSAESRQAAIQQLFYDNNFFHDWYYDAGFNEAAGNAQKSNYGRGGIENDEIHAEGQDYSGLNNANMATPADGAHPRMQMYVFTASLQQLMTVNSPPAIAGNKQFAIAGFGPQSFNVSGDLLYPQSNQIGCTASGAFPSGLFAGKIALIDRGTCEFTEKVKNAQDAGAIAVVIASDQPGLIDMVGADSSITIGSMLIQQTDGDTIKSQLASSITVSVRLFRQQAINRDGTIDNQIVAHEWCHYMSNRLIGNGAGLDTQQSGGLGEGWSDTSAMILTVRADDANVPSNTTWNGVYALAGYVMSGSDSNAYYFGIRRYPYSTDMAKNPLTFQHIQEGVALPAGPQVNGGGGANAEVHNTGEVWANMLWECYAALLRDTLGSSPRLTFAEAQLRMRAYLVASLKMTPVNPTFTEARDAMLAAAYATDAVDYVEFWRAFAKRGIGIDAEAPDRFSTTNAGVIESYLSGSDLQFVSASLDDAVSSCDHDGSLDNGETGRLTITLRNSGESRLTSTTALVTSSSPGVTIANGGNVSFPPSDPLGTTAAAINVTLNGAPNAIQQLDFNVAYTDLALTGPSVRNSAVSFRANFNITHGTSATDTVESPNVVWTTAHSAALGLTSVAPFVREATDTLNHDFFGADPSVPVDEYLISPPFTVAPSAAVTIEFDHTFGFEFDDKRNYDGGVVEMTTDGGATWNDIGTSAYNGMVGTYSGDANPIAGRAAFVATSSGTQHVILNPSLTSGQAFKIRFRLATDDGGGGSGWHIDNVKFTGVIETPFDSIVADAGCVLATSVALAGAPNPATVGALVTLTATVTAPSGPPPMAGTVTFDEGGSALGTTSVNSSGVAALQTSTLAAGAHSITATYNGAPGFYAAGSSAFVETINKIATTTTITSVTPNPGTVGSPVTFTASVTAASGTPSGSVAFYDSANQVCTAILTGGAGSCTYSSLAAGSHSISAAFLGNATYSASPSSPAVQLLINVTPAAPGGTVVATATSPASVSITWSASAGATYEVLRQAVVGTPLTIGTSTSGSYTDNSVTANSAYLYQVRMTSPSLSPYSPPDLATTVIFTDASLAGATVKAVHMTELRTAVNAVRALAVLPPYTFADPVLSSGMTIRSVHVTDLRAALDAARASLHIPAAVYTNPGLTAGTSIITAADIDDLRNGVK